MKTFVQTVSRNFTQMDMELSFVDVDDTADINERLLIL